MEPEDYLRGHPLAVAAYARVRQILDRLGPYDVRASKSQIAFRRNRGFAYLWLPGQYLEKPSAEVVLSFALGREDGSSRLKQVVQVSPLHWMHHLELHDVADLDEEVAGWLREAAERAE